MIGRQLVVAIASVLCAVAATPTPAATVEPDPVLTNAADAIPLDPTPATPASPVEPDPAVSAVLPCVRVDAHAEARPAVAICGTFTRYVRLVTWLDAVAAARAARDAAARARVDPGETRSGKSPRTSSAAGVGNGRCGGDLPPCAVLDRESSGDLTIWTGGCRLPFGWTGSNPCNRASTASGKWQIVRTTWQGAGGFVNAADAPESVQDQRARELWANGAGCSNWSAC